MERVKVKIAKPFMYNGVMVQPGDEVEMFADRAYNHMRVGDVERDENVVSEIKAKREAAAKAALADAQKDW